MGGLELADYGKQSQTPRCDHDDKSMTLNGDCEETCGTGGCNTAMYSKTAMCNPAVLQLLEKYTDPPY